MVRRGSMVIEIWRTSNNGLRIEWWHFNIIQEWKADYVTSYTIKSVITTIELIRYVQHDKETFRHGGEDSKVYDVNNNTGMNGINREEVPIPDDVILEVKTLIKKGVDKAKLV